MAMAQQIHTYAALLQQIHNDLRIQHPDWIQQNGESPKCDSYEARLMKLLDASIGRGSNQTTAAPDCAAEDGRRQIETLANAN